MKKAPVKTETMIMVRSACSTKIDVARKLIEDIRATVTEENRRKALIEAVDAFERRISKEE